MKVEIVANSHSPKLLLLLQHAAFGSKLRLHDFLSQENLNPCIMFGNKLIFDLEWAEWIHNLISSIFSTLFRRGTWHFLEGLPLHFQMAKP